MLRLFEVDARLSGRSGIGRYINEIIARCPIERRGVLRLPPSISARSEWAFVADDSGVYGMREQFTRLSAFAVQWTPHYNFPFLSGGLQLVTVHDLAHLALPQIFGRGFKRLYAYFYFKLILIRADHVIFISEFTRSEFLRIMGDLPRSYSVILNGVGAEWFLPKNGCSAASNGKISILAVGNIKPHKNLKRLIEAVINLSKRYSIVLRVVGSKEDLRVFETDFPDSPCVEWLGYVSDEFLRNEYRAADCFVMPSIYEGFGLPVLEAMAAGCPVAISQIPALLEVTGTDAVHAETFSPYKVSDIENAIIRILELSPQQRAHRIHTAREFAKQYTWDHCSAATWSALNSLEREAMGIVV